VYTGHVEYDSPRKFYYYYSFIKTWHVRTQATEHRQDSTQNIKYKVKKMTTFAEVVVFLT